MRGVYYSNIHITGLNATKTLWYCTTTANICIEILSARVTNASNTTNQQLECVFQRITTLGSPTGTAITNSKSEPGDQAAAGTYAGNVTANEPTYTANTTIGYQGFASLAGWQFAPVPEERPLVAPSTSIGLRMSDTTPTAFDADVEVVVRELG